MFVSFLLINQITPFFAYPFFSLGVSPHTSHCPLTLLRVERRLPRSFASLRPQCHHPSLHHLPTFSHRTCLLSPSPSTCFFTASSASRSYLFLVDTDDCNNGDDRIERGCERRQRQRQRRCRCSTSFLFPSALLLLSSFVNCRQHGESHVQRSSRG